MRSYVITVQFAVFEENHAYVAKRETICLTIRVLTHQKQPRRFCMLFFEVLPFTTLAVSVNGKTSEKSVQK